jgi:hypothetical protein
VSKFDLNFFRPFLSFDDTRPALKSPFQNGIEMVASDGRILIAVPEADVDLSIPRRNQDEDRPGNVGQLFDGTEGNQQPFVSLEVLLKCREQIPCIGCDGHGVILVWAGNGSMEQTCPDCTGSKVMFNRESPVEVGDRSVGAGYLEKIHRLPGSEIQPLRPGSEVWMEDTPMLFRFDGGRGLLMPLRPVSSPKVAKG